MIQTLALVGDTNYNIENLEIEVADREVGTGRDETDHAHEIDTIEEPIVDLEVENDVDRVVMTKR